jgi:hypothetical protein
MRAPAVFLNCSLSLVLGLLIYALIRDQPAIFLNFLPAIDADNIEIIRFIIGLFSSDLRELISNHGADFLWIYGLSIGHFHFFEESLSSLANFCKIGIIPLIIAFVLEVLQIYESIGGTFDIGDLMVFVLGFSIATLVYKFSKRIVENDTN